MEALHDNAVAHALTNLDPDGGSRYVEHTASATMVKLVRHALHHCGIDVNIDILPNLEDLKISGNMFITLLTKRFLEEITRVGALTVRADHLCETVALESLAQIADLDIDLGSAKKRTKENTKGSSALSRRRCQGRFIDQTVDGRQENQGHLKAFRRALRLLDL